MDTGGWLAAGDALEAKVSDQAERALAEADVILMVVDVTTGVTDEDLAAAKVIRRAGPPVRLVVNKVDGASRDSGRLGVRLPRAGRPVPGELAARARHGDLLDEVVALLPDAASRRRRRTSRCRPAHGAAGATATPGRRAWPSSAGPTSGKSTLFNKLLGEERAIVHDMPGTTRDAIDTVVETPDGPVCFIDTAGLRRPSKTDRGTEQHSTMRALRALERADVAVLVIDATIGASHQDQRLAERIGVSGCPAIVVAEQVGPGAGRRPRRRAGRRRGPPGLPGRGTRCSRCPPCRARACTASSRRCATASTAYHQRVPTGALNRTVQELQLRQAAPRAKIRYIVQGAIDPPTFTLFTNGRLPQTYLRYIERGIREKFDLGATPMKLRVRIGGK